MTKKCFELWNSASAPLVVYALPDSYDEHLPVISVMRYEITQMSISAQLVCEITRA